jgi:hypothetical protein
MSKRRGETGKAASLRGKYTLRPKIFALVDFCASLLIIRLIQKNCENVIYFAMICFIIIYIIYHNYFCIFANILNKTSGEM